MIFHEVIIISQKSPCDLCIIIPHNVRNMNYRQVTLSIFLYLVYFHQNRLRPIWLPLVLTAVSLSASCCGSDWLSHRTELSAGHEYCPADILFFVIKPIQLLMGIVQAGTKTAITLQLSLTSLEFPWKYISIPQQPCTFTCFSRFLPLSASLTPRSPALSAPHPRSSFIEQVIHPISQSMISRR